MSNKFGLVDDPDDPGLPNSDRIDLSGFPPVKKRLPIDLVEVDAAAAPHGFVSRESTPIPTTMDAPSSATMTHIVQSYPRRRRVAPEPARALAVRMTQADYERFVAYADRYQLTYHDAIKKLLDEVGG